MQEICQSGSEGGAKRTFVPTPILAQGCAALTAALHPGLSYSAASRLKARISRASLWLVRGNPKISEGTLQIVKQSRTVPKPVETGNDSAKLDSTSPLKGLCI
jgi:hypothetical protein